MPAMDLQGIAGLALGKAFLAIDRAFTGGLERDFAILVAIRAHGLVHHPSALAVICLGAVMGLRERLWMLSRRRPLKILRNGPGLRGPGRCLPDHHFHFSLQRFEPVRFFLQGFEPFRDLHHYGNELRQFNLRSLIVFG